VPIVVGAWGYHLDDAGVEVMRAHWMELIARYAAHPVVWIAAGEASLPWYDRLFLPETPSHAARLSAGWTEVVRTIHPSAALRAPEREARHALRARLVRDLKTAKRLASRPNGAESPKRISQR